MCCCYRTDFKISNINRLVGVHVVVCTGFPQRVPRRWPVPSRLPKGPPQVCGNGVNFSCVHGLCSAPSMKCDCYLLRNERLWYHIQIILFLANKDSQTRWSWAWVILLMKLAAFQAPASHNTSTSAEGPTHGTGVQMFHKKIQSVHGSVYFTAFVGNGLVREGQRSHCGNQIGFPEWGGDVGWPSPVIKHKVLSQQMMRQGTLMTILDNIICCGVFPVKPVSQPVGWLSIWEAPPPTPALHTCPADSTEGRLLP